MWVKYVLWFGFLLLWVFVVPVTLRFIDHVAEEKQFLILYGTLFNKG